MVEAAFEDVRREDPVLLVFDRRHTGDSPVIDAGEQDAVLLEPADGDPADQRAMDARARFFDAVAAALAADGDALFLAGFRFENDAVP